MAFEFDSKSSRPRTYSLYLSVEQVDVLMECLDSDDFMHYGSDSVTDAQPSPEKLARQALKKNIRQKLVNIRNAGRRHAVQQAALSRGEQGGK